ncbi:hypothetical protein HPB47_014382, partial [Ixodes persulcatus]
TSFWVSLRSLLLSRSAGELNVGYIRRNFALLLCTQPFIYYNFLWNRARSNPGWNYGRCEHDMHAAFQKVASNGNHYRNIISRSECIFYAAADELLYFHIRNAGNIFTPWRSYTKRISRSFGPTKPPLG